MNQSLLQTINATIMDSLTTVMLLAFAIESVARVYGMTRSAIRRALKREDSE